MIHAREVDGVRLLRFDHGKVNALDEEFFLDLASALEGALDSSVCALVLTGSGSVFSAGVDLYRVLDGGSDYLDRFLPSLSNGLERLFSYPKPVVAAVNGHAIAGGCVLALAADLRIGAATDARIGLPELEVGVPFPAAAVEVVRFAVGDHRLTKLMLGGRTYPLEHALRLGLLDRLVTTENLLGEAVSAAARLATTPSSLFTLSKAQIRGPARERIASGRRRSDSNVLRRWKDPSTLESLRAYVDRTLKG